MAKLKANKTKTKCMVSCGMFTVKRKQKMYTFISYFISPTQLFTDC